VKKKVRQQQQQPGELCVLVDRLHQLDRMRAPVCGFSFMAAAYKYSLGCCERKMGATTK
jgi:hypothetical protein